MNPYSDKSESISSIAVLQALSELAFILDDRGNYKYVYSSNSELLVRPSEELIGANIALVFPAQIVDLMMNSMAVCLKERVFSRFDYPVTLSDGLHWFEARLAPLSKTEVLFLAIDITERKETAKKLMNSQANLSFILDNTEQSFILIHKDSRLIMMNRSAERLFERFKLGVRQSGEKMLHILPRDWAVEIAHAFKKAIHGSNSFFSKEIGFDGNYSCFDLEVAPICGSDSEPNIIAVGIKDTTQQWNASRIQRQNEARFRFLTDNVTDTIWQTSVDGVFTYLSPGVEKVIGYAPDELIGHTVEAIIGDESFTTVKSVFDDLKSLHQTTQGIVEIQFRHKNGSLLWGEVRYNAVVDTRSQFQALLGVVRDITVRRETELKLKETSARLLELNATKDKFFSLIAHDLKNPMSAISGFSELLVDDSLTLSREEISQYANLIHASASDLNKLLDDMLVWSRTQTGTINFRPDLFDLGLLVNEAIILTRLISDKKELIVVSEIPYDLKIFGDVNMVRTILRNLLSNAIKFSFRGGRIVISTRSEGSYSRISVIDNGIGLSEQSIENLIKSGNKMHTRGTEGESGSGFGLLISREFVAYHYGTLDVESELNVGSSFSFTLPHNSRAWEVSKKGGDLFARLQ